MFLTASSCQLKWNYQRHFEQGWASLYAGLEVVWEPGRALVPELRLCLGWVGRGAGGVGWACWMWAGSASACRWPSVLPLRGNLCNLFLTPWGDVSCPLAREQCREELRLECLSPRGKQGSCWLHLLIVGRGVKSILHLAVFWTKPDKQTVLLFFQDVPRGERKSSAVQEWFWGQHRLLVEDYSSALTRGKTMSHSTSAEIVSAGKGFDRNKLYLHGDSDTCLV